MELVRREPLCTKEKLIRKFTQLRVTQLHCLRVKLYYRRPEETCPLMHLLKLDAKLLYGYLYNMGEKKEKFIPPTIIDRKFREGEIRKVQTTEAPVVVVAENEGIVLLRKNPLIKCETNVWSTKYPGLYLSKKVIPGAPS